MKSKSKEKIALVVDDDAAFCGLLYRVLRPRGFLVLELTCLEENPPDLPAAPTPLELLFFSVHFRGTMAGWQLERRLLRRNPNMRIIYVGGMPPSFLHQNLFRPNFLYLQKPISSEDLLQTVQLCQPGAAPTVEPVSNRT